MTFYIETLGCEKNAVDSETIANILISKGHEYAPIPEDAEIIIVNTCSFIEDAKQESIDAVFQFLPFRDYGKCKKIIMTGCLPERYATDIAAAFPEVDAFMGAHRLTNILAALEGTERAYIAPQATEYEEYETGRLHTGTPGSAFIRIADGCDAQCSFCAIPQFRGRYRSRAIERIVEEARGYAKRGFKELNLIAQETTEYGRDLYGTPKLKTLLEELNRIDGIEWIRALYQNPARLDEPLIDAFFSLPRVVPYFDIPLQHANTTVLKNMRRAGTAEQYLRLIETIRSKGECAVRTSFIVGFPGETEKEFHDLEQFIRDASFDRMGIFKYSEEDNTPALALSLARVPKEEAMYRQEVLMEAQRDISAKRLTRFRNRELRAFIECVEGDEIRGRTKFDAPEVDGYVVIAREGQDPNIGEMKTVYIDMSNEYDLFGEIVVKER